MSEPTDANDALAVTGDDEPEMLVRGPRPSQGVLLAAFAAIVFGGFAGAVIGAGLIGVGCHGSCSTATGFAALTGAVVGAGGVGIVAVLVMRAMSEWRRIDRTG